MREELQDNINRLVNFMNFARSFFKRKNPFNLRDLCSEIKTLRLCGFAFNFSS